MDDVLILGTGDVASAVAHVLYSAGFRVVMQDTPRPSHPRRAMALSDALYDGRCVLEGVLGKRVKSVESIPHMARCGQAIPVSDDEAKAVADAFGPGVIVDARMRKRTVPEPLIGAALQIGLGPNFHAGNNVDVAIETGWGEELGKVILRGSTKPLDGEPSEVGGHRRERFVYSPSAGVFRTGLQIGDRVEAGAIVGTVGDAAIRAPLSGWLRGISHDDAQVSRGNKIVEVAARAEGVAMRGLGERPRRIATGVLLAIQRAGRSPAP